MTGENIFSVSYGFGEITRSITLYLRMEEKRLEAFNHVAQPAMLEPFFKSSHRRRFLRESVFRNFAKLTARHLCQNLFFNKVGGCGL